MLEKSKIYTKWVKELCNDFLSNSYEPSYLDFQAIIKSDWNDYNIAIIELGTMYKIVEDKVPISPISYTLFTIDDITNLNYFKDYTMGKSEIKAMVSGFFPKQEKCIAPVFHCIYRNVLNNGSMCIFLLYWIR